MSRIATRFAALAAADAKAFVAFVMAGDPDYDTALAILRGLPAAGVDVIELGMPFTDPWPTARRSSAPASARSRAATRMDRTLAMVRAFREGDAETPIVLMGYYNPIYSRGVPASSPRRKPPASTASSSSACPPRRTTSSASLPGRRGSTSSASPPPPPTTAACPRSHQHLGLVYYVSITGITGAAAASAAAVAPEVARIKRATPLPVCVGFGIRTPAAFADIAARRGRRRRRLRHRRPHRRRRPARRVLAFVAHPRRSRPRRRLGQSSLARP